MSSNSDKDEQIKFLQSTVNTLAERSEALERHLDGTTFYRDQLLDRLDEIKKVVDSYDPSKTQRNGRKSLYLKLKEMYDSWI